MQQKLVNAIQKLSLARTLEDVVEITRHAARELTGADGATFVLKDHGFCHYVDEDAIGPLWKGKRFPLQTCISGWAMTHQKEVMIEDIFQDERIPNDAYRPTFVKSLMMVPIREENPIGAIGNYWATHYTPNDDQVQLLKTLANSTAIALENVRLIEDLEKSKQSLKSALRSRDEFLSVVSHELRTPMSVLQLHLQMLDRTMKREGTENHSVTTAIGQCGNLNQLVEKLLDVSRIQLNRVKLNYKFLNFSEAVETAIELWRPQLEAAGCEIHTQFDFGIQGEWDQTRLNQMISNLVSNIIKYAPKKPVKISTRLDSIGSAVLEIQDHGPGMSDDVQARVFGRFERGMSSKNFGGLGLGLFLTQGLALAHQGNVRVQSSDQGTTFIIELPVKKPVVQEERMIG